MVHLKLAYLIIWPLLSADLANDPPIICELQKSTLPFPLCTRLQKICSKFGKKWHFLTDFETFGI
jgi:hypothetical protein